MEEATDNEHIREHGREIVDPPHLERLLLGMLEHSKSSPPSPIRKRLPHSVPEGFRNYRDTRWLDPSLIRFTQKGCGQTFSPQGHLKGAPVDKVIEDVRAGQTVMWEPMRVVERDGKWWSIDNRRLYVSLILHQDGYVDEVLVILVPPESVPRDRRGALDEENGGVTIRVRGGGSQYHLRRSSCAPVSRDGVATAPPTPAVAPLTPGVCHRGRGMRRPRCGRPSSQRALLQQACLQQAWLQVWLQQAWLECASVSAHLTPGLSSAVGRRRRRTRPDHQCEERWPPLPPAP